MVELNNIEHCSLALPAEYHVEVCNNIRRNTTQQNSPLLSVLRCMISPTLKLLMCTVFLSMQRITQIVTGVC